MIFLDTSGLFACCATSEPHSKEARRLFEQSSAKLTHSYVLSELITLASARGFARLPIYLFVGELLAHPQVTTIWVNEPLHLAAMDLLEHRADKSYSLCDAVSFVLMAKHNATDALTSDYHFEQEGFRRLLQGGR